jgi:DNA-binding SARP family transcriptional activator
VEFRALGPLEVVDGDRTVALGAKQRALLAILLLSANRVVSVDRLIDGVWGSEPPSGAANALQYHVSQLRKLLGRDDVIVTREPGYLVRLEPDQLDLLRFERLVEVAERAGPARAAELLREALGLWRGEPLADLAGEPFAQTEIRRLQEMRLAARELQIEADVALGRHLQLVPELEALVREHPLRERLSAALMRALYGAGRHADALEVYRTTRRRFVEELGIEPSPALRELEQAVLRHDSELTTAAPRMIPPRAILVLAEGGPRVDDLVSIAEPLSRRPERELILARLLDNPSELAVATAELAARRDALLERGVACRVAAYSTTDSGADAALLAIEQHVDLVLAEAPSGDALDGELFALLDQVPCDVGLLGGGRGSGEGPVVAPFGGADHDWAAIETAAWLATSLETTLRLLGTAADGERRDASRLLARASLLVQQLVGIATEPLLISPGDRGVLEGAADARLLVIGLSDRWRAEGIGPVRFAIAARADIPVLFVRRGSRPGRLAPAETLTRFTWTRGSV